MLSNHTRNKLLATSIFLLSESGLAATTPVVSGKLSKEIIKDSLIETESAKDFIDGKNEIVSKGLNVSNAVMGAIKSVQSADVGEFSGDSQKFRTFGDALSNDSATVEFESAKALNAEIRAYLQSEEQVLTAQIKYLQSLRSLEEEYISGEGLQQKVIDQGDLLIQMQSILASQNAKIESLSSTVRSLTLETQRARESRESDSATSLDDALRLDARESSAGPKTSVDNSADEYFFGVSDIKIIESKDKKIKEATIYFSDGRAYTETLKEGDLVDKWEVVSIEPNGINISKPHPTTGLDVDFFLPVLSQ